MLISQGYSGKESLAHNHNNEW